MSFTNRSLSPKHSTQQTDRNNPPEERILHFYGTERHFRQIMAEAATLGAACALAHAPIFEPFITLQEAQEQAGEEAVARMISDGAVFPINTLEGMKFDRSEFQNAIKG